MGVVVGGMKKGMGHSCFVYTTAPPCSGRRLCVYIYIYMYVYRIQFGGAGGGGGWGRGKGAGLVATEGGGRASVTTLD